MARRLWTPVTERHVCRMPVGADDICGHVCFSDADMARHLKKCLSRNEGAIHDARLESRIPMLEHEDPEVEKHLRKVGDRMLEEGRWEVKPSERAGL